jgi:hypothetical protein
METQRDYENHKNIFYITFIFSISTLVIVKEEHLEHYIIVLKLIKWFRRREKQKYSLYLPYIKNKCKFSKDTCSEQTSFVVNLMF